MSDYFKIKLHQTEGGRLLPEDHHWLKNQSEGKLLNPLDRALVEQVWDQETEIDFLKIEQNVAESSKLKKFALYRVIGYPLDKVLGFFLLDKQAISYNDQAFDLYMKFLFNKIDVETFKKSLQKIKISVKLI